MELASLPRAKDGRIALITDGTSLAFWLLGDRCVTRDGVTATIAAWHLGGEYLELACRTRRFGAGLKAAGVALTCVFEAPAGKMIASPRPDSTAAARTASAASDSGSAATATHTVGDGGLEAADGAAQADGAARDGGAGFSPASSEEAGLEDLVAAGSHPTAAAAPRRDGGKRMASHRHARYLARYKKTTAAVGKLAALAAGEDAGEAPWMTTRALDQTPPPEMFLRQVRMSMDQAGLTVMTPTAEADDTLVEYVRNGSAYAVLSRDSDFAVAEGCRWLTLDMLDTDALMSGDPAAAQAAHGWLFEPATVASALRLDGLEALFATCCLAGQSSTQELCDRLDITALLGISSSVYRNSDRPIKRIEYIAQWMAAPRLARSSAGRGKADWLEEGVPRLCEMSEQDATAWRAAVQASRKFYCLPLTPGAADELVAVAEPVAAAEPAAQPDEDGADALLALESPAAAAARDELHGWARGAATHGEVWRHATYERPFDRESGGIAAAYRPLHARLFAALGCTGVVTEFAWDGAFYGSGAAEFDIVPDQAGADSAASAGAADAAAGFALGPLRAMLLHPRALLPASEDPALALPVREAFAALVLRYLFSLPAVCEAAVVHRVTGWAENAAIACVASSLVAEEEVRKGGPHPAPAARQTTPWLCLELSSLLQACVRDAYNTMGVLRGPAAVRNRVPPPAALFSGAELRRLFCLAAPQQLQPVDPSASAEWFHASLSPRAAELAVRLAAAARCGLQQGDR